jgi:hypothetical protein
MLSSDDGVELRDEISRSDPLARRWPDRINHHGASDRFHTHTHPQQQALPFQVSALLVVCWSEALSPARERNKEETV